MFQRLTSLTHYHLSILLAAAIILTACGSTNDTPESSTDPEPVALSVEPVAPGDALPPTMLAIPDIDLEVDVTPMGWRITQSDGESSTEWDVPYSTAGWHVTSAGAGASSNVIISGHQIVGEAIFAQIALGELEEGAKIYLTDEAEQTFIYEVSTVSEPIPLVGATETDVDAAESFVTPTDSAQLTLMTGWPDFSTTHYLFVAADLVGMEPASN